MPPGGAMRSRSAWGMSIERPRFRRIGVSNSNRRTLMSRLRVASFALSIDGYGVGPSQSLEDPLGGGGEALHEWVFPTRTFRQKVFGTEGGSTGVDDDFVARGFDNVGAWILG